MLLPLRPDEWPSEDRDAFWQEVEGHFRDGWCSSVRALSTKTDVDWCRLAATWLVEVRWTDGSSIAALACPAHLHATCTRALLELSDRTTKTRRGIAVQLWSATPTRRARKASFPQPFFVEMSDEKGSPGRSH